MCQTAWIASNDPLPEVPWNDARPAFHVVACEKLEPRIRDMLPQRYVYHLGASSRCACDFGQGGALRWEGDLRRLTPSQLLDRSALAEYLRAIMRTTSVHLLTYTFSGGSITRVSATEPDLVTRQEFEFTEMPTLVHFKSSSVPAPSHPPAAS